jgi:hypothetical protein
MTDRENLDAIQASLGVILASEAMQNACITILPGTGQYLEHIS